MPKLEENNGKLRRDGGGSWEKDPIAGKKGRKNDGRVGKVVKTNSKKKDANRREKCGKVRKLHKE